MIKFTNNAVTTLVKPFLTTDKMLYVSKGSATLFPALGKQDSLTGTTVCEYDYFYVTLSDVDARKEIVRITGTDTSQDDADIFYVGQNFPDYYDWNKEATGCRHVDGSDENSQGHEWGIGDQVSLRVTASVLNDLLGVMQDTSEVTKLGGSSTSQILSLSATSVGHVVSADWGFVSVQKTDTGTYSVIMEPTIGQHITGYFVFSSDRPRTVCTPRGEGSAIFDIELYNAEDVIEDNAFTFVAIIGNSEANLVHERVTVDQVEYTGSGSSIVEPGVYSMYMSGGGSTNDPADVIFSNFIVTDTVSIEYTLGKAGDTSGGNSTLQVYPAYGTSSSIVYVARGGNSTPDPIYADGITAKSSVGVISVLNTQRVDTLDEGYREMAVSQLGVTGAAGENGKLVLRRISSDLVGTLEPEDGEASASVESVRALSDALDAHTSDEAAHTTDTSDLATIDSVQALSASLEAHVSDEPAHTDTIVDTSDLATDASLQELSARFTAHTLTGSAHGAGGPLVSADVVSDLSDELQAHVYDTEAHKDTVVDTSNFVTKSTVNSMETRLTAHVNSQSKHVDAYTINNNIAKIRTDLGNHTSDSSIHGIDTSNLANKSDVSSVQEEIMILESNLEDHIANHPIAEGVTVGNFGTRVYYASGTTSASSYSWLYPGLYIVAAHGGTGTKSTKRTLGIAAAVIRVHTPVEYKYSSGVTKSEDTTTTIPYAGAYGSLTILRVCRLTGEGEHVPSFVGPWGGKSVSRVVDLISDTRQAEILWSYAGEVNPQASHISSPTSWVGLLFNPGFTSWALDTNMVPACGIWKL